MAEYGFGPPPGGLLKGYDPYAVPSAEKPTGAAPSTAVAGAKKYWSPTGGKKTIGNQVYTEYRDQYGNTKWDITALPTAEPTPEPTPGPEPTPEPTPGFPIERYEFPSAPGFPTATIPRHDWIAEAQRFAQLGEVQDIIRQLETGLGPIRTTLGELLALSPEAIEERYRAEIETPAMRYFGEETLPSVRRAFVGPGTFWSSMRAGAEQRAGSRLQEALMAQRGRMFGEARGQALTAAGLATQLEQQAFAGRAYPFETALKAAPLGVQQRAQDLQRELAQAQLGFQEWLAAEQMKQRERETWGYGEVGEAGTPAYYGIQAPTWPGYEPETQTQASLLGAAL